MSTDLNSPHAHDEPRAWPSYPSNEDEINLADLVRSIWDGRGLIIAVTAVITILGAGYAFIAPNKYETTLELQTISSDDANAYAELNALGWFSVSKGALLGRVIESLDTRESLQRVILDQGFISPDDFENSQDHLLAVESTSYAFEFLRPESAEDKKKNQELRENWAIRYEGPQKPEWVLETLDLALNASIEDARLALVEDYERKKSIYLQGQTYTLEDLKLQHSNLYQDYDKKIGQRLAALKENAGIARSLGLKASTIEAQNYTTASTVVTNIKTDNPLYLRGYEALEKEIEQITSRTNRENFVSERIALEAEIRKLEQDRTIERNDRAFIQTPLVDADRFKAIRYSLTTAETKNAKKTSLILALSVVLGGMLGLFVLFFRNALKRD
jgi:chain length determinant protein (polysaccharide antigen chain regulator)